MKKFLCILFSAAVLLATCGCSAGTSSSEPADEVAPEQLTAKYAALAGKAISAGIGKTVAVLSNGTAIGAGDLVYSLSDWSHVAAVSCAGRNTIGVKSDKTVVSAYPVSDPDYMDIPLSWTDITDVSAGFATVVGLKSDGTVVAAGSNTKGQCNVGDWSDIVAVSAGHNHTVGLRADGTVVATGGNEQGQCNVTEWKNIVAVSAGYGMTAGLTSDGTVVATGLNSKGQCDVSGWNDIVAVSASCERFTVALRADGTVVAAGENDYGQCDVSKWSDIIAISAGDNHTVGLKADGTLVAVGANYAGQCDVKDYADIRLPNNKAEQITPAAATPDNSAPAEVKKLSAIAIVGNAAYEYYNFDKTSADIYAAAISRAAQKLSGKCGVYCTVLPTSISMLDDKTKAQIKCSNQEAAIEYIYSSIDPAATVVDTYNILRRHKDEYLYFRTDHHWTTTAAYYSYTNLMNAAGKKAAALTDFKEHIFEGFLGTLYFSSGKNPVLGNTPDTVYAYEPEGVEFIHTYEDGYEKDYHIISDASKLGASNKYLTFVCGDHPLGVINNDGIADESACLVIKESFGNAMVPYFTQNYHTVYVADYRYIDKVYSGNLEAFVGEHGVNDVFFVNNISATRNITLMKNVSTFVGE